MHEVHLPMADNFPLKIEVAKESVDEFLAIQRELEHVKGELDSILKDLPCSTCPWVDMGLLGSQNRMVHLVPAQVLVI